jgi:predicted RNase H-like HicB family nuclease
MTDHEPDDKAFAAISLAMPNLPPTFCSGSVQYLAAPQPAAHPGSDGGSLEPQTNEKEEMSVRFRTELRLASARTPPKFIAGLAFCDPSMRPDMKHYLAVLVPTDDGRWRAHFPDFPGCRAEGLSVEEAIHAAKLAASGQARWLRAQGVSFPQSQSYEDVRHLANGWAKERDIAWPEAVISLVPLAVSPD